jgi:4-hydroxybenzoate polyprenyltransferase
MTSPQFATAIVGGIYRLPVPGPAQTRRPAIPELVRMIVSESRPPVQVVFLLRLVSFAAAAGGLSRLAGAGAAGVLGWLLLSMAVYVLNGISDVEGDRANDSRRPIAGGRLPVDVALRATAVLALAGLGLCALCSGRLVLVGMAALILGWRYSAGRVPLKATTAGIAVTAGGGVLLCYAAGAIVAGGVAGPTIGAFGLAEATWLGLCAATKDFSDVDGDRLAGRRTWPIVLGDRRARQLVAACSAALGIAFATLAALTHGAVPVASVTAGAGAAALAVAALRCPAAGGRATRRRPYRILMVTQYAVNAALLVGALF